MGWWKYSISITMWLCSLCPSWGQDVRTTTHPSATYCEGIVFPLPIDFSSTRTVYGDCGRSIIYSHDTSSEIVVEQEGVDLDQKWVSRTVTPTYYSSDPILFISYKFKAKKSGKVTVITKFRKIQAAIEGHCEADDYTLEQRDIFPIEVIPEPPTPSLELERYIAARSVSFKAEGCPVSQESPYWWNVALCKDEKTEEFFKGTPDGILAASNGYARVACKDRGCLGKPSDFKWGISYNPPDFGAVPEKYRKDIEKVEGPLDKSRNDYHIFPVETLVCSMEGNEGCTVESVFQILISANSNTVPMASDINEEYASDFYNYKMSNPVKSYTVVRLSGVLVDILLKADLPKEADSEANDVMTYIDYPNKSVTNYTLPGHVFYPGKIIRQVIERCGKIYIVTLGEGITSFGEYLGEAIADINKDRGAAMFKKIDERVVKQYKDKYE